LIQHAPASNGIPLFTPITHTSSLKMSPAEAARWLVERHAFGSASDKTLAKGNPGLLKKDKKSKELDKGKDTPQIGYLAWIGFIAPVGETLFQTLMLNLVPWSQKTLIKSGPDDLPSWEREPLGAARVERPPEGVCDLFSWQGRRIRLFPEHDQSGETVVGQVLICAGDEVDRESVRNVDPHVGWRKRTASNGAVEFLPIRARMGEQVWRGLSSILAMNNKDESKAGILTFLAGLDLDKIGQPVVSLLITSVEFGQLSTVMVDLVSDRLDTPIALLKKEQNNRAVRLAIDAVDLANKASKALYHIAKIPYLRYDKEKKIYVVPKYPKELSIKAEAAHQKLSEELFSLLNFEYRNFLRMLERPKDFTELRTNWKEIVQKTAESLANGHASQLANAVSFEYAVGYAGFKRALSGSFKQFLG
jgi:CRISPR system Cascade subunit CasA